MKIFSEETVVEIENTLKLHINYRGISSGGKYLRDMDRLACGYSGPKALALSNLLDDYFQQVGVKNLDEALQRLRNKVEIK